MSKLTMWLAFALVGASASSVAMDDTKMNKNMDMKMDMKTMDANGDGMISKDEFMKYHEMMYDKMKKNKAGMVDMKEMEMMYRDMEMKHERKPMGKEDMMKKDGMAK